MLCAYKRSHGAQSDIRNLDEAEVNEKDKTRQRTLPLDDELHIL